ncbi:Thymidylate kinase [Candidatus Magnetomoraceae bacterium gMMP-15]
MFITLEGIEGSGKSTQARYLLDFLSQNGHDCIMTREPGGTRIGSKIRNILLEPDHLEIAPLTELLLYAADRAQHIQELIKPALDNGKTIICDRFYDATTVYQGCARNLNINIIKNLHDIVLENLRPDFTLLFDLPVSIGLKRAWKRINNQSQSKQENRFENENQVFHERVRAGYLELAKKEPSRFKVIHAEKSKAKVSNQILKFIKLKGVLNV